MKADLKPPGRATGENKNCAKAVKIFRKELPLNIEKAKKDNMRENIQCVQKDH